MKEQPKKKITLVDGAMVANNPVIFAYGEAKKLYPNCNKFHILSLSTASIMFGFGDEEFSGGVMGWIDPSKGAPIQKVYASSQMQVANYMAQHNFDIEYTRVDYAFENDKFKLDDTSAFASTKLEEAGNIVYDKNEEKIFNYVEKLIKKDDFSQITSQKWIEEEANKDVKQYKMESYIPEPTQDKSDSNSFDVDSVIDSLSAMVEKVKETKVSRLGFFKNLTKNNRKPVDNTKLLLPSASDISPDYITELDEITEDNK